MQGFNEQHSDFFCPSLFIDLRIFDSIESNIYFDPSIFLIEVKFGLAESEHRYLVWQNLKAIKAYDSEFRCPALQLSEQYLSMYQVSSLH